MSLMCVVVDVYGGQLSAPLLIGTQEWSVCNKFREHKKHVILAS